MTEYVKYLKIPFMWTPMKQSTVFSKPTNHGGTITCKHGECWCHCNCQLDSWFESWTKQVFHLVMISKHTCTKRFTLIMSQLEICQNVMMHPLIL